MYTVLIGIRVQVLLMSSEVGFVWVRTLADVFKRWYMRACVGEYKKQIHLYKVFWHSGH